MIDDKPSLIERLNEAGKAHGYSFEPDENTSGVWMTHPLWGRHLLSVAMAMRVAEALSEERCPTCGQVKP